MNFEKIELEFSKILSERQEIIAAYLYGSILNCDYYEDVDIGLYIQEVFEPDILYEVKIAGVLEKRFKDLFSITKPVDVRILNGKPLRFLFSVLKSSKMIYSKEDHKRVQFEAKIMKEYIDFKPHHMVYDEMRRVRYANR